MNKKQFEQKIDEFGELYLIKKAPFQLPANVKEIIVKYCPYLIGIVILLSIPTILTLVGFNAVTSSVVALTNKPLITFYSTIAAIFSIANLVLSGLSIPGLLKRNLVGWRYSWYAALVSAVGSLLTLNLFSLIIGLLISMYFLYQIKSMYK